MTNSLYFSVAYSWLVAMCESCRPAPSDQMHLIQFPFAIDIG